MAEQQKTQTKGEETAQKSVTQPTPGGSGGSLQSGNILGSKISLITNALVRYEGVLNEVDPVKKSMTLINVKSFGTEGRRNGISEIPVLENEIPGVQFKVDQIKDFNIISKPDITQLDPAILSTTNEAPAQKTQTSTPQPAQEQVKQESEQHRYAKAEGGFQKYDNQYRYKNEGFQRRTDQGPSNYQKKYDNEGGYQRNEGGNRYQENRYEQREDDYFHSNRGRGGHRGDYSRGGEQRGGYRGGRRDEGQFRQKRNIGELEQNPNEVLKEQLKDNFDFQQHQLKKSDDEEHNKEEDKKETAQKTEEEKAPAKYDKSAGFFDTISNSTQNKPAAEQDIRAIRDDVRKKDADTFGFQSSSQFQYQGGSRGRGNRGRGGQRGGGRGGYRGSGRGGYQDNFERSDNQEHQQYQPKGRGDFRGGYRGGYSGQNDYSQPEGGYRGRGRGGYDY